MRALLPVSEGRVTSGKPTSPKARDEQDRGSLRLSERWRLCAESGHSLSGKEAAGIDPKQPFPVEFALPLMAASVPTIPPPGEGLCDAPKEAPDRRRRSVTLGAMTGWLSEQLPRQNNQTRAAADNKRKRGGNGGVGVPPVAISRTISNARTRSSALYGFVIAASPSAGVSMLIRASSPDV